MKTLKINSQVNVPDGNICNFLDPHFNVSKQLCRFCVTKQGTKHCALFNMLPLSTCGTEVYKCEFCTDNKTIETLEPEQETVQIDVKLLVSDLMNEFTKAHKQLIKHGFPEGLAVSQAVKHVKDKYK